MPKFYSPSTRGFPDVPGAGHIPITEDVHAQLLAAQRDGREIETDAEGVPLLISQMLTVDGMRGAVFPEARRMRKDILDALTGIGYRALVAYTDPANAGDEPLRAAALQTAKDAAAAQVALLDVTKDARVLAVTPGQGPEVLRETILNVYRERAAATPASVRSAFKEATL